MPRSAYLSAAALSAALFIPPAQAQLTPQPMKILCGSYQEISKPLAGEHKEHVAFRGVIANGSLMELWKSDVSSWTIVFSRDGYACVIADGEGLTPVKPPMKGDPS